MHSTLAGKHEYEYVGRFKTKGFFLGLEPNVTQKKGREGRGRPRCMFILNAILPTFLPFSRLLPYLLNGGSAVVECKWVDVRVCYRILSIEKLLMHHRKIKLPRYFLPCTAGQKNLLNQIFLLNFVKGQLISEWYFGVFKSPKKPTRFLP